jgi:tetratricopeptide (TPR) repeat protein
MSKIRLALIPAVIGFALAAPAVTLAVPPEPPAATTSTKATTTPATGTTTSKPAKPKAKKAAKKQQQSELKFQNGFKVAYDLIYTDHKYADGFTKLRSLKRDNDPDVANLLGYTSRKLGHYDDSQYWYEKALAADPRHARTWSYYGMWHAEQGNTLKALDYLETVKGICGTECREYAELKGVIEGTRSY